MHAGAEIHTTVRTGAYSVAFRRRLRTQSALAGRRGGGGPRLARIRHRCQTPAGDRTRLGKQPRSAFGRPQCRDVPRTLRHPARRALPGYHRDGLGQQAACLRRSDRSRPAADLRELQRQPWRALVGGRSVWPHPQPQGRGIGHLHGFGSGAARRTNLAGFGCG